MEKQPRSPDKAPLFKNVGGVGAWSVEGAALEYLRLVGMVRDEEGLTGCSPGLTTWGILSLAGEAVGLRGERSQSEVSFQNPAYPTTLPSPATSLPGLA